MASKERSANKEISSNSNNPADLEQPLKAGLKLRQVRENRSLSLEQVAQGTRIRIHYLHALEAGDFDALPSLAQARGFLRAYAGFLGLDGEALLNGSESPFPEDRHEKQEAPQAHPSTDSSPLPASTAPAPAETETLSQPSPRAAKELPVNLEPGRQSLEAPSSGWEAAQPIFIEIGQRLKRQRELLGISLEDVERHTHLRQHYLQALEAGDLEGLPSPVQGRGMLNNYAIFLGMDPEPLLLRFADGLQTRLAAKKSSSPSPSSTSKLPQPEDRKPLLPKPLRRFFSTDVLLGFIIVASLTAFITWGILRIFGMQSDLAPTPTTLSIAEVLLASPTPTASATPIPATPTSPLPAALQPQTFGTQASGDSPLPAAAGQGKVQIYVSVRQRTWMRVIVDGEVEFEGRVLPGSAYTFIGNTQVEILTGNGAGLQIYFGQSDLGVMGGFGQVVHRIYTPLEVLEPTPTITPTGVPTTPATETPAVQSTADSPAPTATSAPSLP